MNGSLISTILITVAFSALAFVLAYILVSTVGKSKIDTNKRMEDFKKREGDVETVLVKSESKRTKKNRERKSSQNGLFVKVASALYKELQAADIKMRPEEFLLIWVLVALLPSMMVLLIAPSLTKVALILVPVGGVIPFVLIKRKQKSRVKQFDEQLSDALMIACSSLRSGLSFTQAMEAIAKDMADPIAYEFRIVLSEMNMGTSMDDALERLNTRINSQYLPLMVSSVLIQRQTGGNLSSILEGIANAIKEKMKLKQELKASTASGKTTGLMVGSMPVVLCVLFLLINREFIMPLFVTPTGHKFIIVACVLEFLCFIAVKKITNVKM